MERDSEYIIHEEKKFLQKMNDKIRKIVSLPSVNLGGE
jgi:hypothetical protein